MTARKSRIADTPGRRFFDEQIAFLQQGKTDELIDRHYHDNAVLISTSEVVSGRDALKRHFGAYVAMLGKVEIIRLNGFIEARDSVLIEAVIRTTLGESTVYDAFMLSDGKVTHHFTGTV